MGFRSGVFCKCWSVESVTDTFTKGRISISRKNRQTDEYEDEFSDFVMFCGSGAARKALSLQPGDRIKIGDVDVTRKYVKDKDKAYYNFKIFSFETQEEVDTGKKMEQEFASQGVSRSEETDDLPF